MRRCVLLTALFAALGCGGGTDEVSVKDGLWTSRQVRVEVVEGVVTAFQLQAQTCAAVTAEPDCGGSQPVQVTEAGAQIDGGAFLIERDFLEVQGFFDAVEATGTWRFIHPGRCCTLDGTWFALPPDEGEPTCPTEQSTAGADAKVDTYGLNPGDGALVRLDDGADADVVMGFQGFRMVVLNLVEHGVPTDGQQVALRIVHRDSDALIAELQLNRTLFESHDTGGSLLRDLLVVVTATEEDFVDQSVLVHTRLTNECGLDYEAPPLELVLRRKY